MQLEWDNSTNGCPGSDSSGNPPSHPNYDTPRSRLTPNFGYGTAPFKILGQFFAVGDKVSSTFTDAGSTTPLGSSTADASGHTSLMTKVPGKAKPGTATVTSKGSSGHRLVAVHGPFAVAEFQKRRSPLEAASSTHYAFSQAIPSLSRSSPRLYDIASR